MRVELTQEEAALAYKAVVQRAALLRQDPSAWSICFADKLDALARKIEDAILAE